MFEKEAEDYAKHSSMTVKEFIEKLKTYDENLPIKFSTGDPQVVFDPIDFFVDWRYRTRHHLCVELIDYDRFR